MAPGGRERRLSRLFDLFTADDVDYQLAVMLDKKEVSNRAAKAAITAYLQLSDRETRPSVLGTVQTHLRLFDSDVIRKEPPTQRRWISMPSLPANRCHSI
jgi:type IV secretory pathway TraG/TraD family ATPase VirD4